MVERLMNRQIVFLTAALLLLSVAGQVMAQQDPSLLGWWKLNDGAGTVALDSSGYGNHGTVMTPNGGLGTGGSVWFKDPERGMVISFNGTDGSGAYVDPHVIIPALTMSNGFTWVFWAKQPAAQATNNDTMLGNRYGGTASPLQFVKFTPTRFECYNDDGAYANGINYASIPSDVWIHHALVKDGASLTYYRNGVVMLTNTMTKTVDANPFFMGADGYSGAQENWEGYLSDVRLYARALSAKEVQDAMAGKGPGAELAGEPVPEDEATDVPRDATLNWTAGQYPAVHDVYLGTVAADVNNASRTNKGLLVSQGQADTTFDPAGVFAYGQTYYWRIDEVNKSADGTVYQGGVWSFTAEPYGYPITSVTATASSSAANMGPENTINGSGLDKSDLHGTEGTTMWLSGGAKPNWIQYQFDKVYKLYDLKVWNSNQLIETFLGFGAKNVTIETSTDGTAWTALANVPEFAKATGLPGYAANTTVNLGGVMAQYVKLTINANWGGVAPQTGLSEVRFSYIPVQARAPQPATVATGVTVDPTLNWRPGREAGSHQVFFGTDQAAVAGGTAAAKTVTDHAFAPGSLNFGTTYYWKVDEVNTTTYLGDVWSFTTQEYAAVDDFETYNDTDNRIYDAWIDGYTDGKSGSIVGNMTAPFAEQTIIHGGKQSMPFEYNNVKAPYYSEASRTFEATQNWTTNGADTLSLYFRGRAVGFADNGNGTFSMSSSGTDVWNNGDQFRFAYKSLNGDGSIVARVDSIANTNVWAKGGVMIRQSIDTGSTHAFMPITAGGSGAGNGASFQRRLTAAGASTNDDNAGAVVAAPYWVKVERKGNSFTGSISPDGKTWTPLGTAQTITMTNPVLIGLALCSHDAALTTVAEFSNVSVTGTVTGSWQDMAIGATM
ncbi:MAG: discoidin domain-containing protein, partial [Phycisphaerae bacterium]|nr:discoidin domain-containing protein [Phycisphaerae bacterium]